MTFLEDIEKRQQALVAQLKTNPLVVEATLNELRERTQEVVGRTLGLKVPDALRERLLALKESLGAKSYRQVVLMAVEVGTTSLESITRGR